MFGVILKLKGDISRPAKENNLLVKIVELWLFEFRIAEVVVEAVVVCTKSMGNKDFLGLL